MSRLGILWSEASFRAKIARAIEEQAIYPGIHMDRPYRWLKGQWAYLGVNGARHCLWRLGLLHTVVDEAWLQSSSIDNEVDALLIPEAEALEPRSIERLQDIAKRQRCWLIIAGATNLPDSLLGVAERSVYVPQRYVRPQEEPQAGQGLHATYPVSPPGYPIDLVRPLETSIAFGGLEEWDPYQVDVLQSIRGPALIRHGKLIWIPVRLFEYIGGLLQAQVDWWPLHQWLGPDAFGYVDRLCQLVARWLRRAGAGQILDFRVPPWGSHQHAAILRHDTDDSLDATYWEIEKRDKWPATYAVLIDKRAKRWAERLRTTPEIETALHYRTNREGIWERLRLRLSEKVPLPDVDAATQDGLLQQVRKAKSILGAIKTIHRHYQYVYYPELLLALETLYEAESSILGAGSFARFHLARYGEAETIMVTHPHVGIPFWFPIRPVIATVERHTSLQGWESTALIEPTPDQIRYCAKLAEEFPGGCYTWVFHPAHTHHSHFAPHGALGGFRVAQEHLGQSWWVTTTAAVYQRVSQWSQLTFRKSRTGLELLNASSEPIREVVLQGQHTNLRIDQIEAHTTVQLPPDWLSEPAEALVGRVNR